MKLLVDRGSDCGVSDCYSQAVGYVLASDQKLIYFCQRHEDYFNASKNLASVVRFLSPSEIERIVTAERRGDFLGRIAVVVVIAVIPVTLFYQLV